MSCQWIKRNIHILFRLVLCMLQLSRVVLVVTDSAPVLADPLPGGIVTQGPSQQQQQSSSSSCLLGLMLCSGAETTKYPLQFRLSTLIESQFVRMCGRVLLSQANPNSTHNTFRCIYYHVRNYTLHCIHLLSASYSSCYYYCWGTCSNNATKQFTAQGEGEVGEVVEVQMMRMMGLLPLQGMQMRKSWSWNGNWLGYNIDSIGEKASISCCWNV